MSETYTATLTLPPALLALIRKEAEQSGNSLSAVMRRRILDSYQREAADLGYTLELEETERDKEPILNQ